MQAIGLASGILGLFSSAKSLFNKEKAPQPQALPAAPSATDANALAEQKAKNRRLRMANTDLTRGSALTPQVNVEKKTLLGV